MWTPDGCARQLRPANVLAQVTDILSLPPSLLRPTLLCGKGANNSVIGSKSEEHGATSEQLSSESKPSAWPIVSWSTAMLKGLVLNQRRKLTWLAKPQGVHLAMRWVQCSQAAVDEGHRSAARGCCALYAVYPRGGGGFGGKGAECGTGRELCLLIRLQGRATQKRRARRSQKPF